MAARREDGSSRRSGQAVNKRPSARSMSMARSTVSLHAVLLLQVLDGRQGSRAPLARPDPHAKLPVSRTWRVMNDNYKINIGEPRSTQNNRFISSPLLCSSLIGVTLIACTDCCSARLKGPVAGTPSTPADGDSREPGPLRNRHSHDWRGTAKCSRISKSSGST
jgi:hypothetical protein